MQIRFFLISFSLFLIGTSFCTAQQPQIQGPYRLPFILEGRDTVPVVNLPDVIIVDVGNPEYLKNLQDYYRLRYNVIKVYPYARLAAVKLNEMNYRMAAMRNDRERRKYRRQVEDQVRKDFEGTIKHLSINQGKVLIKLIDRETGSTSYDLIKSLKGSFNAFFAQGLARLFGQDLKDDYDPADEDKTIEMIVRQIEDGSITL
jgi:hypothetical protein